jgi:cytoskeleton protein RodZ
MQTIGERLEEARKKKGISIREAAEATKIRGEYLQKFEGNQFEIGLTDIYTRGFLRGYANYLRIPSDRLLSDYTALRGGEPRVRQPSREVYGRMDLAISSADERGEAQAEAVASESVQRPQTRFQRPGENLPKAPPIDPALVFKGGIISRGPVVLVLAASGSSSRSRGPARRRRRTRPRPRSASPPRRRPPRRRPRSRSSPSSPCASRWCASRTAWSSSRARSRPASAGSTRTCPST